MELSAKASRRRDMVEAAARAFARKGYHAASVADIIAEAGVARGTFYLYFGSKQEAFSAILDGFVSDLARMAAERPTRTVSDQGVPAAVRGLFLNWLRYFSARRELAAVVFQHGASQDPEFKERCRAAVAPAYGFWEAKIAEHQALGITNPALEPGFLRSALIGLFAQVVLDAVVRDGRTDLEALADQFLTLLTRGVFIAVRPGGIR